MAEEPSVTKESSFKQGVTAASIMLEVDMVDARCQSTSLLYVQWQREFFFMYFDD